MMVSVCDCVDGAAAVGHTAAPALRCTVRWPPSSHRAVTILPYTNRALLGYSGSCSKHTAVQAHATHTSMLREIVAGTRWRPHDIGASCTSSTRDVDWFMCTVSIVGLSDSVPATMHRWSDYQMDGGVLTATDPNTTAWLAGKHLGAYPPYKAPPLACGSQQGWGVVWRPPGRQPQ